MNDEIIKKVEAFVENEFKKHPHHSFGDWTVMRDHSMKVRDLALQIGEDRSQASLVLVIAALLHDIGKTYEADVETLHAHHEEFNLLVSEVFLDTLGLSDGQLQTIKDLIGHTSDTEEMRVLEDADALAFYADKRLYMLFIEWARERGLGDSIQKKLDKFDILHFERSRQIGKEWYEQMRQDWGFEKLA